MNAQKLKIRNRLSRFRPQRMWPAVLAALAILIIAGFGSDHAFAASTDLSTQDTGKSQHHEKIKLANHDNTSAQTNSPRVSQRPFVTPAIAANGVRMYDVQPNESGGWPTRLAGDDTYGYGELLAVEVQFTDSVNVNGNATFRIQIGSSRRDLVPVSYRDDSVIFATLIQSGDVDTNGVWIGNNSSTLDHNPANYFQTSEGNQNVSLTHSSLGTQSSHKVDGRSRRPKVNRVRITSSPQHADYYVRGEEVQVEIRFDRSVVVSGNPQARLRIEALGSTATRTANYLRGSGTSTLVFAYNVSFLDNDSNGIAIPANALAKNGDISMGPEGGGSIKGTSRTLRANLASGAQGNNASHKVDARYAATPEVMANAQWGWQPQSGESESVTMNFTVREDPGHFSEDHNLVMALGWGSIGSTRFVFGIRTDVDDPDTDGSEGKGILFNRWGTHDTSLARPTDDGWVGIGRTFGDFISIRKAYDWGVGDYTVRMAHDGSVNDADGRWFGMWITDPNGVETYMGSLKFPFDNAGANPKFNPRGDLYHSMMGVLGRGVIKPHEIPVFEVALSPPDEGSSIDPPKRVRAVYSQFNGVMTNSNITHDREDNLVIMRAGGTTLRTTNPGTVLIVRNDEATGEPSIRGTTEMDQNLSVSTSDIADADGLDGVSFTYQWIRVDGTSETDIRNATRNRYTLLAADVGKTIKVRVSFTDDAGYSETLTSDATDPIRPPLTAEFTDTPTSHNGQGLFTFELRFNENVSGLSYVTLRDSAFTLDGGRVTKARRLEPPSNVRWEITVRPDGNGEVTITLPATTDCTDTGAICTRDGGKLSNESTTTVSGPSG
ncbi:MAG: hypothetical protein OXF79_26995 [Chloroflexi bacterium]|nr:hypothetical protein [Chloroflexota bacterium]